jgi:hypothetical protein
MTEWIYPIEEQHGIELALMLGYTHALCLDAYDWDVHVHHPAAMILPASPFLEIGPLVVVRELVLDARGRTQPTRRGTRARTRLRLRLHPAALAAARRLRPPKGWGGPLCRPLYQDRRGSLSLVRGVQDVARGHVLSPE